MTLHNSTSKQSKVVALLPMKANSTRVPGKNFRKFCGKPLFRWTLDTLLEVELIDKVVINTDARQILSENGLKETDRIVIRDRRSEICGDHVSMNLVIEDDINNVDADVYLMTHTTNPLMSAETVYEAITTFRQAKAEHRADSLFSVNKIQTRLYRADCTPINHDPTNLIPTQNLEPWFEENSNLYLFSAESFIQSKARIGLSAMMFETPPFESVDIDTQSDWDFAVLAAKFLQKNRLIAPS